MPVGVRLPTGSREDRTVVATTPGGARRTALVAVGGALGAGLRWAAVTAWPAAGASLPWAVLAVNVVGAGLLGLVLAAGRRRPPGSTAAAVLVDGLGAGVCGGLTTASTVAVELAQLIGDGRLAVASGYLAASIVLGGAAVVAGLHLGSRSDRSTAP